MEELLEAGIDVDTTVNIQHLESLNDKVFEVTGVRVRETFPDRLLHQAGSVVVVDLPPEALRERIAQGRVYAPEKVPAALTNFFRAENLTALRALVLREVAARLGATVVRREGAVAPTVVAVATELGVTQIVLGESHRPRWREALGQSIIAYVLRETDGVDILIVADARARLEDPHETG